jgi:Gram-negative bacterial TonB protein C-terminal
MRFAVILTIALFCQSASIFAKAEKEPIRLKPSSAWTLDYAEHGCRMVRAFGEGENKSHIILSRYHPNEQFSLIVAGKLFKLSGPTDVRLQFGAAEAEQKIFSYGGSSGDSPAIIISSVMRLAPPTEAEQKLLDRAKGDERREIELAPISAERQKAIKYLRVGKPLRNDVTLELGAMDKPMAAMSKCVDNLLTTWGIDVEKHKTLTRRALALTNPSNWLNSDDYPKDMLVDRQPALVEFRLDVDEMGKATGCYIQATTKPKEFDDAVCKGIMRRAKFDPALDAEGKPMKSYYKNRVHFRMTP